MVEVLNSGLIFPTKGHEIAPPENTVCTGGGWTSAFSYNITLLHTGQACGAIHIHSQSRSPVDREAIELASIGV